MLHHYGVFIIRAWVYEGDNKLWGVYYKGPPFVCDVPFAQLIYAKKNYIYIINFGTMISFGAQLHAFYIAEL